MLEECTSLTMTLFEVCAASNCRLPNQLLAAVMTAIVEDDCCAVSTRKDHGDLATSPCLASARIASHDARCSLGALACRNCLIHSLALAAKKEEKPSSRQ